MKKKKVAKSNKNNPSDQATPVKLDYIYGIDVGCETDRMAWVKINNSGELVDRENGLIGLQSRLLKDIQNNLCIAIGFEAVMWYPLPVVSNGQFKMERRFSEEVGQSICYQGNATATTIKTLMLENNIFQNKPLLRSFATKNKSNFLKNKNARIFLYEGFCTGEYKPEYGEFPVSSFSPKLELENENQIDAYVIASALLYGLTGNIHPHFPQFKAYLEVEYNPVNKVNQYLTDSNGNTQYTTISHQGGGYWCIWEQILEQKFSDIEPEVCNVYGFKWEKTQGSQQENTKEEPKEKTL